jgi:hypothetical protein
MIEDAPVLVVDDEENAGVPEIVVLADRVVDVLNEGFPVAHIIVWVLVGRRQCSAGGVVSGIVLRLNEAVGGDIVGVAIADSGEVRIRVVEEILVCHETAEGERSGPVGPINAGRDTLLGEFFVDSVETTVELGRHVEASAGCAAVDVEAIGQGGSGD